MKFVLCVLACVSVAGSAFGSELDGTWDQDCAGGMRRTERFNGERAVLHEVFHSDASCAVAQGEIVSQGPFVAARNHIDFVFEGVWMQPLTEGAAAIFNRMILCGFTDWRRKTLREISGLECEFFSNSKVRVPSPGDRKYGIYRVESGSEPAKLYFGRMTRERDGSSPERRPVEWDSRFYQRRGDR